MDFSIPDEITALLKQLDQFIEDEIKPLEQQDDNMRFFDHRREYARTDFENGGVPRKDWEELLAEMLRLRWNAAGSGQSRASSGLRSAVVLIDNAQGLADENHSIDHHREAQQQRC